MATKTEVIRDAISGRGCLGKAADNEPVFVLRAQDKLAALLVDDWAEMAEHKGCPKEKVAEAQEIANAMRAWPKRKNPD
jgi:hypothetical protein